jgi:hypothetical protein
VLFGAGQAGLGDEEGLGNVRTGLALYEGPRAPPVFWPILQSIHAGACLGAGRPEEGLGPLQAAMDIVSPFGGSILFAQYEVLKGDLLAAHAAAEGRTDPEAEQCYLRALDRARAQSVRIIELRALTRLATAATDTASHRAALATLLATFDEGLDSPDLVAAREALVA